MATFHDYRVTRGELQNLFQAAAAKSEGLLLLIRETGNDPLAITEWSDVRVVKNESEILPLLRAQAAEKWYLEIKLEAVFNLRKNPAEQMTMKSEDTLKRNLTPAAQKELQVYEQKVAREKVLNEWARQSWFKKLFTTPKF